MAVRFLPPPSASEGEPREERGELAEVLDLRSRLPRLGASARVDAERSTAAVVRLPRAPESTDGSTDDSPDAGGEPFLEQGAEPESEPGGESESEQCDARDAGVRLLARKALSSGELRRALQSLGCDSAEIETVVAEFTESLYLDDLGLARILTEGLRERKRASRSQIRVKLRERLLDDDAIEQALSELGDDEEHELLVAAASDRARRLAGLDRVTAERRLLGYLARRGWSGEPALRACREALDASGAAPGSGVSFR